MRADPKTESSSSEGSPTPKQDPLERRRLQNRLSQRNHRRKIRDRIAKLQERVIANELRATAALNGWDQTYSSPYIPEHHHSPYYEEPELTFGSRVHSPQSTEPSTPVFPYNLPQSYSTDLLAQPPESLEDPCYVESALGSEVPNQFSPGMHVENDQDMEFFHDPWGTLRTETLMGDLGSLNQPNLYIATVKNHRSCVFRISTFAPNWAGIKQPVNEFLDDESIELCVSVPTTERTPLTHTSNTTSSLGNSWAVSALRFTQDLKSTR
ncbi:hypothetical protein N7494_010796 [Penicillium frequentans]|uniref:BZIP domain-containing protein n=1 Tax=Penicillium frequentans TaxID=3151616 RepID=A0AAD6CJ09_9EURO|nr:hypothetical protein N7494_010796 [Penicillium glabrum]